MKITQKTLKACDAEIAKMKLRENITDELYKMNKDELEDALNYMKYININKQ